MISPAWVYIPACILATVLFRFRLLFILPALLADAWYAPVRSFAPEYNVTTLIVISSIIVCTLLIRYTRLGTFYGVETT